METKSRENPSSEHAEIIMSSTDVKSSLPSSVILKADHFSLQLTWDIYKMGPWLESLASCEEV